MAITIQFYKIHPENYSSSQAASAGKYSIERLNITAFESLNINLNTPISPMPLPEDNSEGNILVKMEGNSKQVRCSFKIDKNIIDLAHAEGLALTDLRDPEDNSMVDLKADDSVIDYTNQIKTNTNNIGLVDDLLRRFESRSITDTFWFRVVDWDPSRYSNAGGLTAATNPIIAGRGTINSIDTSADSASPVVWNCNIDYLIGDVISIYDADTPDQVNDFDCEQADNSGTGDAKKKIKVVWSLPDRAGGSPITSFTIKWETIAGLDDSTTESKNNFLKITHTTSGSTGSFPLYDSGTGKYTKILTVGDGALAERTYAVSMYANNTGGSGTKSDIVTVLTPAG